MFEFTINAETFEELSEKILLAAQGVRKETVLLELKGQRIIGFAGGGSGGAGGGSVPTDNKVQAVVTNSEKLNIEGYTTDRTPEAPAVQEELDADGKPWDAAIHSASKAKTLDGKWRSKRGLKKEESKPSLPPLVAPKPVAPVAASAPSVVPLPPPPILGKFTHTLKTFKENIVLTISGLIEEKKIDQAYIDSICKYFNVSNLWEIFKDEAKIGELYENFVASGLITRAE